MSLKSILVGAAILAATQVSAAAPPAAERYTLERADGGFVRLDRTSGAISLCRLEGAAGLVCRLAADDRLAYEAQLGALQGELARLKAQAKAPAGKPDAAQNLEERKADANDQISLVEFILTRMIHAARNVAGDAQQEKMAPPANKQP
jgi:hypothetical protein